MVCVLPASLCQYPWPGGAPQFILESKAAFVVLGCPSRPGASCVGTQGTSQGRIIFSFDPISGARHEIFAPIRKLIYGQVSPDGARIALTGNYPQGRIEILSMTGQVENRIAVKDGPIRSRSTGPQTAKRFTSQAPV